MGNKCYNCNTEISNEKEALQLLAKFSGYKTARDEKKELGEYIKEKGFCDWCGKPLKEIMLENLNDKTPSIKGLGSISSNYYVSPLFQNKILTIKSEKEPYEIDKILENNIETKILVYEDRVNGWFLDFARKLTKETNSEFVVLMICMNYLEGNQQFREGKSSKYESIETLKRALKRIFPDTEENILIHLVDKVRHGLFHEGMTKKGVLLRYDLSIPFFPFTFNEEEWLELDPSLFLKEVRRDFELYINILKNKDNKEERENFERHYKERYG